MLAIVQASSQARVVSCPIERSATPTLSGRPGFMLKMTIRAPPGACNLLGVRDSSHPRDKERTHVTSQSNLRARIAAGDEVVAMRADIDWSKDQLAAAWAG